MGPGGRCLINPSQLWETRESKFQARTPWVDPACANCPGFLVPGAAGVRFPSFVQEHKIVLPN